MDTRVAVRGRKWLRIWNPGTCAAQPADFTTAGGGGQDVTMILPVLPAASSLFLVSGQVQSGASALRGLPTQPGLLRGSGKIRSGNYNPIFERSLL